MTNVTDGRQRPIVPEINRHLLRYRLFQAIRDTGRLDGVIAQDLRPLWRNALTESAETDSDLWARGFYALRSRAIPRRDHRDRPALRSYVQAVETVATDRLHITWQGQPTRWAGAFIHALVEERAGADGLPGPDPTDLPRPGESSFSAVVEILEITVNPAGAWIRRNDDALMIDAGEHAGRHINRSQVEAHIPAGQFFRFAEWDDLRKAAYATVDRIISEMQAEFESWYPAQRPSTRDRLAVRADWLCHYLISGEQPTGESGAPLERADLESLSRFAVLIGVDYSRSRHSKARRKRRT